MLFIAFAVERVVRPLDRADAAEIERVVRERHHRSSDPRPLASEKDAIHHRRRKDAIAAAGLAIGSLVVLVIAEVVSLKVLSVGRPSAHSKDIVLGALAWSGYVLSRYVIQRETRPVGEALNWELRTLDGEPG